MQRYFAELKFKGTGYFGWQIQPRQVTVQEVLESAFSAILRHKITVTGAGRTDTGVHAEFFVAHFEVEDMPFSLPDLVYKLNRFLPRDISILRIRPVSPGFHARFSAVSRTYNYYISRVKDPFDSETSFLYTLPLEVEEMNRAASVLLRHTDFTSFSKLHTDVKTNFCKVSFAQWKEINDKLVFTITADRFLRNMVRAIVGTLLEVGKGKLSVPGFEEIILKKDRCAAGTSVPAHGLFLTDIRYPADIFL